MAPIQDFFVLVVEHTNITLHSQLGGDFFDISPVFSCDREANVVIRVSRESFHNSQRSSIRLL